MGLNDGFVLNSRYEIEGQLGKGGMGTVYLARDLTLRIQVAVKENLNTNPEAERQFRREASLLASLRHPNLPRVTDHFILDEKQYLVMDFIDGEDLETRCARQTPTINEVLGWADSIIDALIFLHSRQPPVIHRDIKPANIKLQPDGNLMLVDFGIAKIFDKSETTTGARGLTPGYSPPEQYGGASTDHRSDQYSLGATIYNMLSGERPIDSIERMFNRVKLKPLTELRLNVPEHVDRAVLKSLTLDPNNRFPDMVHFKAALRGAVSSATIQSEPILVTPTEFAQKRKTNRLRLAGAGAVLLLGLGGLYLAGAFSSGSPEPEPTATSLAVVPTLEPSPTTTPEPSVTTTVTPIPTTTSTSMPTATQIPTATPVPIGGGGLIAFVSDRGDDGLLQIWTMRTDGTDLVQRTFGPGNKSQPRWSPDGQRLVYVSDREGNLDIFVMNTNGTHVVNLTNNPSDDYDPAWSPDGQSLGFVSTRVNDVAQVFRMTILCSSLDMDCSAEGSRNLSIGYAVESSPAWSPLGIAQPAWMPQDAPIAVSASINGAPGRPIFRSSNGGDPVWFDRQDRLKGIENIRWSPDGEYLVFTWKEPGISEIYAFPISDRGNTWFKLTNSLGNREPAVSPDGQWIVFNSTRDQNHEIYIMSISGSNQTNLTNHPSRDMNPDWQPLPVE
jgi:serine/threonine protein kinase